MYGKSSKNIKKKKGSIQDIMFAIGILVFFSVGILIAFRINTGFVDEINQIDGMAPEAITSANQLNSFFPGAIDNSFLLLTIGLAIVALILAGLVRVHPLFIGLFFVALILIIFLAGIGSNIYQGMAENSALSAQANQLTIISNVMVYLPFIIGIFGTILMVVMYKNWSAEQNAF